MKYITILNLHKNPVFFKWFIFQQNLDDAEIKELEENLCDTELHIFMQQLLQILYIRMELCPDVEINPVIAGLKRSNMLITMSSHPHPGVRQAIINVSVPINTQVFFSHT